ncbi:hypothetical protein B0A49_10849 [Cryomyces minteri]|uniref:Uncharacterized protein n=1 Tax=Cryomyces minteri TaxID=331657 RepID=A0A4U0WQ24_9PEZI|nr:hypothetical protein B0A49_10849 [Cryomyces minteri]
MPLYAPEAWVPQILMQQSEEPIEGVRIVPSINIESADDEPVELALTPPSFDEQADALAAQSPAPEVRFGLLPEGVSWDDYDESPERLAMLELERDSLVALEVQFRLLPEGLGWEDYDHRPERLVMLQIEQENRLGEANRIARRMAELLEEELTDAEEARKLQDSMNMDLQN